MKKTIKVPCDKCGKMVYRSNRTMPKEINQWLCPSCYVEYDNKRWSVKKAPLKKVDYEKG